MNESRDFSFNKLMQNRQRKTEQPTFSKAILSLFVTLISDKFFCIWFSIFFFFSNAERYVFELKRYDKNSIIFPFALRGDEPTIVCDSEYCTQLHKCSAFDWSTSTRWTKTTTPRARGIKVIRIIFNDTETRPDIVTQTWLDTRTKRMIQRGT